MTLLLRVAVGLTLLGTVTLFQAKDAYQPLGQAASLLTVLQSNLKATGDWLGDKDFLSAAESIQCVTLVARMLSYQIDDPKWRELAKGLEEASEKLLAAARAKNAAGCDLLLKSCKTFASELASRRQLLSAAENSAKRAIPPVKDYVSFGTTKYWMLVMDGTYVDAKTASSTEELEELAWALAEEANAVAHVRSDARWQKLARDMQSAAMDTIEATKSKDLAKARQVLKNVYVRCEACHQGYKR